MARQFSLIILCRAPDTCIQEVLTFGLASNNSLLLYVRRDRPLSHVFSPTLISVVSHRVTYCTTTFVNPRSRYITQHIGWQDSRL